MNPGLAIFKRHQRFQTGTEEVPPWLKAGYEPQEPGTEWVSPSGVKKRASAKDASGLYAPSEQSDEDYNIALEERERMLQADEDDLWEQTLQRRRETMYATIGVNINGEEVEIPVWDEEMTPEQAEDAARDRLELGLSPFASDMELETALDNNAKRLEAERPGYAQGTSNVNNMGLRLFMAGQGLHKPKQRKKKTL